jgi:acyl dehydratase
MMTGSNNESGAYRVRARNTHTDSENRIHDDETAARYGFRGGLVPGVTVFAYMTVPVVERFSRDWLERGRINVRFIRPFYEGDEVVVRAEADQSAPAARINVTAEGPEGVSASAVASIEERVERVPRIEDYPWARMPAMEARPGASRETLLSGAPMGTLRERFEPDSTPYLESISERLPVYYGELAPAHPAYLLGLANQIFVRNFKLGPWIHASSEVINFSAALGGEEIEVRGRIGELFERKGHEFVTLELLLISAERVLQQVRHTAIYRIGVRGPGARPSEI